MPSTCVPQYLPRTNTGLSKHGDPVFPHFWSWNQNLAHVCTRGGGGGYIFGSFFATQIGRSICCFVRALCDTYIWKLHFWIIFCNTNW